MGRLPCFLTSVRGTTIVFQQSSSAVASPDSLLRGISKNRRGEDGTNLSIVLVERENSLGGKIGTLREDGFVVEAGPDGFLTRKPWALDFANELGLSEDIVYMQATGALLLVDGKLHRIPLGLMGPAPASRRDVWSASFLSWRGKLRASLEPAGG